MELNCLKAFCLRISDGDTVVLVIRWLDMSKKCRVRLAGINAEELNTAAGVAAKDFLKTILEVGAEVIVQSHIVDNYGRVLGTIWLDKDSEKSINQVLVENKHAKPVSLKTQIRDIVNQTPY